jgi:hypothetical protein
MMLNISRVVLTLPPVLERDRRLTGYLRGQSDRSTAPEGFELNNPWKVSHACDVSN